MTFPMTARKLFADVPRASRPLDILILGGTGFLGPHQVQYALARGAELSAAIRIRESDARMVACADSRAPRGCKVLADRRPRKGNPGCHVARLILLSRTNRSLIEHFPGIGSVEPAPASCRKSFGRHQSSVHAHTIRRLSRRCPVRQATAVPTTVELNGFVAPSVAIGRCVIRDDAYVGGRVVGPQSTITSTDGAVAIGDFHRRNLDLQFHRTAMAGGFNHGSPQRNLICFTVSTHCAMAVAIRGSASRRPE